MTESRHYRRAGWDPAGTQAISDEEGVVVWLAVALWLVVSIPLGVLVGRALHRTSPAPAPRLVNAPARITPPDAAA